MPELAPAARAVLIFATAFALTYLLTPLTIRAARRFGVLDRPDPRKVHRRPTARLGGLAIVVGVMVSSFLFTIDQAPLLLPFAAGAGIIVLTGLFDDLYGLPPLGKLAGQLLAAGALLYFGLRIEKVSSFSHGEYLELGALRTPLTLIWIVAIANMMNFIDGLDGLAAGVAGIAALALAAVNWFDKPSPVALPLLFALAGSSFAFLRYNWHPARVFMGDTGSLFLGFTLGVASTAGAFKGATLAIVSAPFIALFIPIADMLFAIARRVRRERPIFKADKEHLHHQLLKAGFRHDRAVLSILLISAALGVLAVFLTQIKSIHAALLLALAGLLVGGGLARFLDRKGGRPDAGADDRSGGAA